MNASGTLAQLKYGIQDIDGKEEFTEEILRQGNYENDKALVANYVKNAAPALDWLTEKGVELTPSTINCLPYEKNARLRFGYRCKIC